MSRIGRLPVPVPSGVDVQIDGQQIVVKGPKGELSHTVAEPITVARGEDGALLVTRPNDERESRSLHGLSRTLINNMVVGVTQGYKKTLEIQGVGYKAEMKGKNLVLSVGYANTVSLAVPGDVSVQLEGVNKIHVTGADKQAVGEFAAQVRKIRKPEPYKGKGIRYEGEVVKIKPGKAFAGAGAK